MSSLLERHPSEDLLSYLDGELSPRESRAVAGHLNSCSQCRAELQGLQDSLADCTSYHRTQAMQMPPAPEPWRDLYHDFARIDRSLANTSLLGRLMSPLVHSGVPRWAFVAGLAGLIVLLTLNQLRQAPSVQAATLLRKAVAVSQSQARPAHRIRVRSSRQPEFTRLAGAQAASILGPGDPPQMMEQFFALLWGDLLLSRLLGADAPTATEVTQRASEATAAFLKLYGPAN